MIINKITNYNKNFVQHKNQKKYPKTNVAFKAINFEQVKSLTDAVSKQIYSKKQVVKLTHLYPEAQGLSLGTTGIPLAWINRIADKSKFDIENFIESLGKIFTSDRHYSDIDVFQESLRELFNKHGIINKNDTLELKYLEKGFFGRAFQLIINGDIENSKVLKEYKRTYRYHNNHGNFSEQNIAEYINRYSGSHTNMVRYHFGDTKNGYMVVDYISKDTPNPEINVELEDLGIAYDDNKPRNFVNNYIIDYGGIITINNLAGNKIAQDIHRRLKYLKNDKLKQEIFTQYYNQKNSKDYEDEMVGLTHSIKFFPYDEQAELYNKMYDLNLEKVNIALVECIKFFRLNPLVKDIINGLASSEEKAVKIVISREIRYFPEKLKHQLFEKLSKEPSSSIKKYLARNLNQYYKNIENRINIFDNLAEGANTYASIALANSLSLLSSAHRDSRFEKLLNKNDIIVTCALARNIEIFENDKNNMKKWIDILMGNDDIRVKRALCESVNYISDNLKEQYFVKLLEVQDMNAKEFLAEIITSIPNYHLHPEWFEKIMLNSGNSVKRELAKLLSQIKYPDVIEDWTKKLWETGDSSVKEIIKKQGLM